MKFKEWIFRFAYGGLVSLVAGWIGQRWGPLIGGLSLAFPSILPATVTLVKKHDGRAAAANEAYGAIFGSVALVAFAGVLWATAESWGPALSLSAAGAVWLLVAWGLWRLSFCTQLPH